MTHIDQKTALITSLWSQLWGAKLWGFLLYQHHGHWCKGWLLLETYQVPSVSITKAAIRYVQVQPGTCCYLTLISSVTSLNCGRTVVIQYCRFSPDVFQKRLMKTVRISDLSARIPTAIHTPPTSLLADHNVRCQHVDRTETRVLPTDLRVEERGRDDWADEAGTGPNTRTVTW
jgi:hypothetical protein